MLIYGIHAVGEALRADRVRALRVSSRDDQRLRQLLEWAAARGIEARREPGRTLDDLTSGAAHQGVVADVLPAPAATLPELVSDGTPAPLIVVLDGIEDPQNVGAVIRTVDAVGGSGIVRQTRRAAMLGAAVAKASAGAVHHVRVADVVNIARALGELKELGIWTVGLDANGKTPYYSLDLTMPTALVLGAEGHGLRRLVRERCDFIAAIPMVGHVSSLNVSAAAAIVLFEAVRQRSTQLSGPR